MRGFYPSQTKFAATARFMGRISAGAGVGEELTPAQVNSVLPIFTPSLNGLVPLSGGGTSNFLRADGIWAPAGGSSTPNVTTQAAGYTATATSGELIILASGTVDQEIALPTAIGNTASIIVKKIGLGGVVTINPFGTQTIDGQLLDTIVHQYEAMRLISDNANWMLI